MTLLYLVAAWAAGIFLVPPGQTSFSLWIGAAASSFALAYLARRRRMWRLSLVCAACFALGAGRQAWATRPLPSDHIGHFADVGYVSLTGIISRDPDVRDAYTNLYLDTEKLAQNNAEHPIYGRVLIQAPRYGDYAYGDQITARGTLLTPPEFDDFSYRDYLARSGIYALMPNAEITLVAHDQGKPWYVALYRLKDHAQQTINRLLPSPQAPLLSGILLGVDSSISPDTREAFNRTGMAHIIAISGANIVVVIRVLMGMLTPSLGKRRAGWITMGGIAVYAVFVGAEPTVIRAAIMGGLALLAVQSGRKAHGLTSLAFSIWLMTLWNPMTLWDVSFQLSAAATAGLILFSDDLTRWLENTLQRGLKREHARQVAGWLTEPLVISVAAQITTTPLILVYFGRLSVISLLANILIVPVQAYIMTLGWLAVLVGMIWTVPGELLAWIVWLPLTYTLEITRSLSRIEWASFDVNFSPSYAWAVYGILLGVALVRIQHPEDRATWKHWLGKRITAYSLMAGGTAAGLLVWIMAFSQPDGSLHVYFLDVGQGNAVLIQTPNGAQILVDGGPNPTRLRESVGDALPYWDRTLDMVIVTQPKDSASKAIPALLDRYTVKQVVTSGFSTENTPYLEQAWKKHHLQVLNVTAGYRIETGDGVILEVLHPQAIPDTDAEPNHAGMVLRLSYGNTSFLIAPELDTEAVESLVEAGWFVGSTVLVLPTHGSEKTNSIEFLTAVDPQIGVVMVEAGNRAGLPDTDTIERLRTVTNAPLYRTDHDGTIEMITDGKTLSISTER
ncbi:MAG: ComEC/Rec2 family competence protein [Chloroflexi bacterium]|nr:ComEC/Rec2 family competence protein [Chloroflexota bacterium]